MCEGMGDGCLLTGAPLERQKRWMKDPCPGLGSGLKASCGSGQDSRWAGQPDSSSHRQGAVQVGI